MTGVIRFLAHVYLTSGHTHHRSALFAIAATVFIFGILGLGMVEGLVLYARRVERSREVRGEGSTGFVGAMHRDFEKPGARARLRILWVIVGIAGLVAVVALIA